MHHSERGVQYTAISFGKRLAKRGRHRSLDGKDRNRFGERAMAQSFIATLGKTEQLVHRRRFADREAARSAIFFEYLGKGFTTDAGCIRL